MAERASKKKVSNRNNTNSEVMQFLDLEARRNDSESESEPDEEEPRNGFIDDDEQSELGNDDPFRIVGLFGDENGLLGNRNTSINDFEQFLGRIVGNTSNSASGSSLGRHCESIPDDNLLNIVGKVVTSPWGQRNETFEPTERLLHGQWVRPVKGLYKGDLALVWAPRTKYTCSPSVVTVLLPARIKTSPASITSSSKKRKLSPRPPAMRVERRMIETAKSLGLNGYDDKKFYNGLLVAGFNNTDVKRSKPLYTELHSFSEAGLDVRPWKRYLAQDTLRFGDRVIVHGGPHHGRVGALHTCWSGRADIVALGSEDEDHPTMLQVDMRSLDRHFLTGDNVRTIKAHDGDIVRYGQVISVSEVTLPELTQRRNEIRRTLRQLALDDLKRRGDLLQEMRRMKEAIWRKSRGGMVVSEDSNTVPDADPNIAVDGSDDEEIDYIRHGPEHIAPMYDYSFFGVRYVEITIFDEVGRTTFVASHVELEFYEVSHLESTIVPDSGFRTDVQSTSNVPLSGNELARRPAHRDQDQRIFHRVLIFKGHFKSYIGECLSIGKTKAHIRLNASGQTVEVPFEYIWNLTRNAPFDISRALDGEINPIRISETTNDSDDHCRTPIPDSIDPFFLPVFGHNDDENPGQDHWLMHQSVVNAMRTLNIFLRLGEGIMAVSEYQVLSVHTLTPTQFQRIGVFDTPGSIHCRYRRRKGELDHMTIPISNDIHVAQPRMRGLAMVVKDPGTIKVTNPQNKKWSGELVGSTIIGKLFKFLKKDLANRENRSDGFVAALQLRESIGDVPSGSFLRVPIDFVCGVEIAGDY